MKKELTEEMIRDYWLQKYHNTNSKDVVRKHPEVCKTADWFKLYPVTQAQHDEWHEWMIEELRKYYRCSKKFARQHSWAIYLHLAPYVIKDKPEV
jgi:hypothetical protein